MSTESKNTKGSPAGARDFEIRPLGDYYVMIRERWYLGLACALLVSCATGYYLLSRPPLYESEAKLLVEHQDERVVDIPQVVSTEMDSASGVWRVVLEDHVNQLTGRSFRQYVIDSFSEEEKERILAPYIPEDPTESAPPIVAILADTEVENLLSSFMLEIRSKHRDPEVAAMIANRYMNRYIEFMGERKESVNAAAIQFLREQAVELGNQVQQAEQALQEYQQKYNLVSVEEDQTLIGQRLMALNEGVTGARVERLELETQMRQMEAFQKEGRNLLELNHVASLGSTPEVIKELDHLRRERQVLQEKYLERHPQMVANARAISAAEKVLDENIALAVAEIRGRLANVAEREETLHEELREAELESLNLDRLTMRYMNLQREAESARKTYAQIEDRLNQTMVTSQLETSNVRAVDPAVVPRIPVEPNIVKVGALVLVLGGFCFLGAPIGLGTLDRKLKAVTDVEFFLGQKLIGEISSVRGVKEKDRSHIVERDLNDQASEAFRGIFSQIQLSSNREFPKTLMATSTLPGEGKSFFASNLGFCFSAHGHRTLMIDFDLRRPTLHRNYGLSNDAGVLRWLAEGRAPDDNLLADEALGIV